MMPGTKLVIRATNLKKSLNMVVDVFCILHMAGFSDDICEHLGIS
jgi:hypothetical protein